MTFGQKLTELMAARGLSLRRMAKQVYCDASHVSKIRNGHRYPSEELGKALDAALDAGGELVALIPKRERTKDRNAPLVGMVQESHTPNREDDVRRRAALQVIAAISAGIAVPPQALETALSGIEDAFGNPLDIAEWERLVADYDYQLHSSPAGALIGDLTTDIVAIGELFKRRLPPLQQASLSRVCAALSGLLAIEFGDADDRRSARIAWNSAIKAADASGDQKMQVWTRGRAAQDAFWTGRAPVVVAKLANEAEQIAGGDSSPGLARAYDARAWLAVQECDKANVYARLADVNRTCEQISDSGGTQSVFEYRETQRLWSESFAYVHVGDERAEASLSQARSLYPANALAPHVNLTLMESVSLVRGREVGEGLQLALTALEGQGRTSAGGRLLASSVLSILPPKDRALPEAREIRTITATV
ncbi:hypothetical protein GCM10022254_25840 [Actinomadura meridiana]|uniref:HTH cro/C1-type domain-containing protein n=1 Tax=Actinomadura meridiana TaxID=559626 RepID=A0ABP8BYS5_9ACTN